MNKFILAIVAIGLAGGCAAQKQWEATGGSRADGTVTTAYEYTWLEAPTVDDAQGIRAATASCANWGYTRAEPFGGFKHTCESHDGYGNCTLTLVEKTYQCLGAPDSARAREIANQIANPVAAPIAAMAPRPTNSAPITTAPPLTSGHGAGYNPNADAQSIDKQMP